MKALGGIDVTIDTREKDKARIKVVTDYFRSRGACVIVDTLETCDYHLTGLFGPDENVQEINVGIEFKTGTDMAGSFSELPDRFARAYNNYDWVGLIIQHDHQDIIDGVGDSPFYYYQPTADLALRMNYYNLQGLLRTYALEGVLVGQTWQLFEVPRMMVSFLYHVTTIGHRGIEFKDRNDIRNPLMKFPGISTKKATKLVSEFGSLDNIFRAPEKDIQKSIGKVSGQRFREYMAKDVRK